MFLATLFGYAVFFGLMGWVLRAYSLQWRRLASAYGDRSRGPALASRFPEQVVLNGGGVAFKQYVPVTVRIHEAGISLAIVPPLSLICPPLFLPFDEMECRPSDWFLYGQAFAIRLPKSRVEVILDIRLWEWLQSHSDIQLHYPGEPRPDSRGAIAT